MPVTQASKAARFAELHQSSKAFIIANTWDFSSTRLLAGLGFPAIATSSAAAAATVGRHDGQLSRDQAIAHAKAIVDATDLPVSADLENGFGDSPENVAETVRRAAEAGLAGCTIEDSTGDSASPLYDFTLAVERIAAAVEVTRALPYPFMLTARAHNFIYASPSLDDTIRRLQAYERVGAHVLFAPALPDLAHVRQVCSAISKPFNFMVGIPGKSFTVAELAHAGVRRISLATSLYRAAMTSLAKVGQEVLTTGSFAYVDELWSTAELQRLMSGNQ